jgi:hypothetical protein
MEIKSPWTMVWSEYIDDFISFIKGHLPVDHELQSHELYPGIKIDGEPIFIVDDDTTGKCLLMDFNNKIHWNNSGVNVPTISIFKNDQEVEEMIERDHRLEINNK